ncbi:hypothetical protein EI94DRAFT_1735574, partial [Lactarius quietus]
HCHSRTCSSTLQWSSSHIMALVAVVAFVATAAAFTLQSPTRLGGARWNELRCWWGQQCGCRQHLPRCLRARSSSGAAPYCKWCGGR